MSKVNQTKIIQILQKAEFLEFNNGCSISKMDKNTYVVSAPTYCQNESGIDIYTLDELRFFIKTHSSIFQDLFDTDEKYKKDFAEPAVANLLEIEKNYSENLLYSNKILDRKIQSNQPQPPKIKKEFVDFIKIEKETYTKNPEILKLYENLKNDTDILMRQYL